MEDMFLPCGAEMHPSLTYFEYYSMKNFGSEFYIAAKIKVIHFRLPTTVKATWGRWPAQSPGFVSSTRQWVPHCLRKKLALILELRSKRWDSTPASFLRFWITNTFNYNKRLQSVREN
jgi:hypothetical protein